MPADRREEPIGVASRLHAAQDLALLVRQLVERHTEGRSLGFLGLRERVLAFGGTVDVKGDEGKGTRVSVSVPMTANQPAYHA